MEEFNMVVGVKFMTKPGEQWTIRRDAYQRIRDEFEKAGIKRVGDGFVARILRDANVQVTTLDIQADLKPDVLGSVERIPLPDHSFDISICCQVLEHLPFDQFETCLKELHRVARRRWRHPP